MGARERLGLIELANRTKNGLLIEMVNTLVESDDLLKDSVNIEANGTNSHKYSRVVSEITGTWTVVNEGADSAKSLTVPVVEDLATLEAYSQIDDKELRKVRDKMAFRKDEDATAASGFAKQVQTAIFYGSGGREILGLANRFNSLSMSNVYDGGGSANLTSIWIIQWGRKAFTLLYPMYAKIGLDVRDDGLVHKTVDTTKTLSVWQTHFMWEIGMAIYDDKNVARIANVDTTVAFATSNVDDLMIRALNKMKNRGRDAFIYVNSDVLTQFDINAKDKTNVSYGAGNVWGEDVTTFKGRPVRLSERLVSESAVS